MKKLSFWLSLLLVFTIPWEAVIEHPVLGTITRIIGFALAVSWTLYVLFSGHVRKPEFFHIALCAFVALNAASILWSTDADRTITHILTWAQLLVMSFIFWDLYTTRTQILAALQMYVLGCYVVFGCTVINYIGGQSFYSGRFSAEGTSPDDLAVILALGVSAAAYLAAFRPADRIVMPLRILNCTYIVAALSGIVLSGTRTALIVAFPGILFSIALWAQSKRSARITVAAVLIALTVVLFPLVPESSMNRLGTTRTELQTGDLNGRVELWKEGLQSFKRHPLLGVGSNMFRSVNSEYKVAHNSFLSVLVELGMGGFLLFVLIVGNAALHALSQPRREMWLWMCILVSWGIGASALTWEYQKATWLLLSLIVASAAAMPADDDAVLREECFTAQCAAATGSPARF